MSQTQKKRLKLYAIVATVSIAILAVSLTGGLYAKLQTANGNSITTSNDNILGKIHYADTNSKGEAQSTNIAGLPPNESNGDSLQIVVTGSASKKINPDKVSITLGVETQEKTAKEAASKNADAMNAIIKGLKALGLSESEISTSYYNIYPVYEYPKPIPYEERPAPAIPIPPNNNPILVGYRAVNTITITTSADRNVGEIIDAATDSSANQVQGINFFVSEEVQRQMNQELIEQAVLNAKTKAERALAPLNMQIVGVKNINLNDVYFPVYSYAIGGTMAASAPAPTPVLPSQQQVSASVSVTFMIGSK